MNPPDVRSVLHCGPPADIETYIQEVGCGGRDGKTTHVTLFYSGQMKRFVSREMIEYCEQTTCCRRDQLFRDFDLYVHATCNVGCKCCDFVCRNVNVVIVLIKSMMKSINKSSILACMIREVQQVELATFPSSTMS